MSRIDAKPSRFGDTVRMIVPVYGVPVVTSVEVSICPGEARDLATKLTHAAGVVEANRGQSCVCASCGTFYAASEPGQSCTCGQPLVAVEASL